MSDYQVQVQRLIDEFVARIGALAHAAATELVQAAVDAALAAVERQRELARQAAPPAARSVAPTPATSGKRDADAIEQAKARVLQFVRLQPGLRIEQINRELGTSTRELALPLRKLIAEGRLRTEGAKRSTQYFPAGEAPRAPSAPPSAPAPVRRRRA